MPHKTAATVAHTIGIDTGKNTLHLIGLDDQARQLRYPPRSASWIEEMEKRSRRRTRDLVTQAASQGLSQNEIGCARISMMARSTNAPCKGRIQIRKTNPPPFAHIRLATHGRSIQLGQSRLIHPVS